MFKKLWEWIKHPHGWPLIPCYAFTAVCIAGAIVFSVFGQDKSYGFVAYIFYGFAAVTFGWTVYTVVVCVPKIKRKITEKLKVNRFTASVLENYDFKTTVFALISFVVTVAFATMNLVSAIRYRLIWYGAIAAYYFVLIFFRGVILLANRKCGKKYAKDADAYEKCKWQIYLASGAFLILLEFAMIGAITQMMLSERPAKSGEIMAITNAAYTFYKVIMAVYHLVKARKLRNPVTQSLRNLNFADACMSVVSLTVLLLATFDDANSATEMRFLKFFVGFIASAAIIAIATFMIVKSTKKLKSIKGESVNEQSR